MLIRNKACVIILLSNVFVFYQVMHIWTYCSKRFINIKIFEKNVQSRCWFFSASYLERWLDLLLSNVTNFLCSWEIFMASVPYSCKSANKLARAACKELISTVIFFFFISSICKIWLITYKISYNFFFIFLYIFYKKKCIY